MIEKRRKYLQRRTQIGKSRGFFSKENRHTKEVDGSSLSQKLDPNDELTSLLDDEFAPEPFSDSDLTDEEGEEKEQEFHPLKVIFASRTHSQLSQFVKELQKTEFASKITSTSLGSRQNLCINPEVTRLKSLSLMNERCLDLQKGSKGKKKEAKKQKICSGCPYFNQTAIEELKSQVSVYGLFKCGFYSVINSPNFSDPR